MTTSVSYRLRNAAEDQIAYLTEIFVNCSRYELGFWDMAWRMRIFASIWAIDVEAFEGIQGSFQF